MRRKTKMFESLHDKRFMFFPDHLPAGDKALIKKQSVDQTFEELTSNIQDLEKLNIELREARRAAFNLLEDAVQSKEALRQSEQKFRTKLEQEVVDRTAEVKKSEKQYVSLVENTPDVITRWNKYFKLVYANTAFASKTGTRLKDLYGKTVLEIGQPENIAVPYMNSLRKVFETGEAVDHYNSYPTPNGEMFFYSRIVPEKNEEGEIETVLVIERDITELKKSEQEVVKLKDEVARQAEDKYRNLFNSMTEGFIICEMIYDEYNEPADWKWLEVNPAFEKQVNLKDDMIVGKLGSEVFPEMDETLLEKYASVLQTKQPIEFEQYSKPADKWLFVRAIPFGEKQFAVLFEDIDERKKAEIALRESEQQILKQLGDTKQLQQVSSRLIETDNIESLYDEIMTALKMIMHSDMVSLQLFSPEKNALRLLAWKGFHPESAKRWEWVEAGNESVCGTALQQNRRIIVPDVENWDLITNEQDLLPFRLSGIRAIQSTPLISRTGKIVGMVSTYWATVHVPTERELGLLDVLARQTSDLIERNLAQEALRRSDEQLKKLNASLEEKVTERTKELEESGHQVRELNKTLFAMNRTLTGLNSELKTFADIAADSYVETLRHLYINLEMIVTNDARNLSNTGRANLRRAQAAILKMKLTTDDLISFSKLHQIGHKEDNVELDKILQATIADFVNTPNHPTIKIDCHHLPHISGYPSLLSTLFHHLLDNAIKFRREDDGTVINISCKESVKGNEIDIDDIQKNTKYTVISIADNGIGFPQAESKKIFEMFYRIHQEKGKYRGSGAGLTICKKIMEMHGGFIAAESEPSQGSVFSCYFPPRTIGD